MNRKLFFLLDRLQILPAERKAVVGLTGFLVLLVLLNITLSPTIPYGDENYRKLEEAFRRQSAKVRAQEAEQMERYLPVSTNLPSAAASPFVADTLPADTLQKKESSPSQISPDGRVNINTAGQQALESLPGIGPVYARRIITYRNQQGSFKDIGELINIKGIGEKRLDKLKPFIKLRDSD